MSGQEQESWPAGRSEDEPTKDEPAKDEKADEQRATEEEKKEEPKETPAQKEEPKKEETKKEEVKKPEPKKEEQKKEEPKKEEQKKEEPKKEEPKKEEPKKVEQKKEPPKKAEPKKEEQRREDKSSKMADSEDEMTGTETSDGRARQREFFKEELRRLQDGLKRESSKIVPPARRKYRPFVFNTLEPYYNTHTTKFLIEMPEESDHFFTFSSRNTAQGLTDPWIDLRMDQEILPQISSRPNTRNEPKLRRKKSKKNSAEPSRKEGSTRLPKFPVVTLETKELATKQLYYSDVPMLRKELKSKYSSQARSKVDADYKRTQQDFYRMDLDRLDQVAPVNRRHMTSTYMAYLQNTPGSRRAVTECVRTLEGKAN